MYQRDYILRLIERFARALILLRNRILKREADQPLLAAEIGEIAKQAGLDLDVARRLDPATLLMWLSPSGEADPPRFWLMAELLHLHGLQARAEETEGGRADFERALTILLRLPAAWRPSEDFCTTGERVAELRGLLSARAEKPEGLAGAPGEPS
jgi:hypothetical protein